MYEGSKYAKINTTRGFPKIKSNQKQNKSHSENSNAYFKFGVNLVFLPSLYPACLQISVANFR